MYFINKKAKIKNENINILDVDGFMMVSKNKCFHIEGQEIKKVKIVNKKLAGPLVVDRVNKKYKKLIRLLTELLISDDDTGESFSLALDEIEKFRQEIKNKYRNYLDKKELEMMAKQLSMFQKEAKSKYNELCCNLTNTNKIGKSR